MRRNCGLVPVVVALTAACASALRDPVIHMARAHQASVRAARPVPVMAYNPVKAPNAEDARKKNPTGLRKADKFAGVKQSERKTKKNTRGAITKKKSYKRGGSPFDRAIHRDVSQKMSERFAGQLVDEMKEDVFREISMGEGRRATTFVLAKEFGFCWGVERSIELAWAAREAYPDKRMHLTNELIHNPGVNELLGGMDIAFLEKDAAATGGKRFDTVGEGDVVILPAFGASLEEMQLLDDKGVTTVDTTCPWVAKVWTTVDKHELAEMTSLIHGKYAHEEAIATASMCETYLIIKDIKEAMDVVRYILQEEGCLTDDEFLAKYQHAASPHFHPRKHLKRIGLANQTTMYKKETQAIGRLLEKTMMAAFGPDEIKERFAAFDTICDATQVRQDAVDEMSTEALDEANGKPLDFILVVGGWDSSNTAHLLEIPHERGICGYHVNTAQCIKPDNAVEHREVDGTVTTTKDFLALDRPMRIGVTSGASTPDSVVQECMEALALVKKLAPLDDETDDEAGATGAAGGGGSSSSSSSSSGSDAAAYEAAPPAGFEWGATH